MERPAFRTVSESEARFVVAWHNPLAPGPSFAYFAEPAVAADFAKLAAMQGSLIYLHPVKED